MLGGPAGGRPLGMDGTVDVAWRQRTGAPPLRLLLRPFLAKVVFWRLLEPRGEALLCGLLLATARAQ